MQFDCFKIRLSTSCVYNAGAMRKSAFPSIICKHIILPLTQQHKEL